MKHSKQKQELINSIKEMEDVYNDNDTPAAIKDSLEPSIRNAKEQLKQLEQAEQQQQQTVTAEKKVAKTAPPTVKKKKAVAKKKAATTVRKVEKRIEKKLPSIRAAIKKAQVELTKVKGRTARGKEADASRKALPPGTRVSKTGNTYREYRENRADVQRKKAPYLAAGGKIDTPTERDKVFGYTIKYMPDELVDDFKKAQSEIESEPDKESLYYHNRKEALEELAQKIDYLFMVLETGNVAILVRTALYAGIYNYKAGLPISAQNVADALEKASKQRLFARGGVVGSTELRRYVNEQMENAGIDMEEFNKMVADAKWDIIYGSSGLDEDYAGFVTTTGKINDALQQADIPDTLYYDLDSGAVSESEPDAQEGEEWYEVKTKVMLFGDLSAYFRRGGRIKSATNRDRKYKSDEPWEKNYRRKTRPKNPRYSRYDEGGQLEAEKKYHDLYLAAEDLYEDLRQMSPDLDGEQREDVDAMAFWLEEPMKKSDHSNLFSQLVADIEWLNKLFDKDWQPFAQTIEKVKKALQTFKWFIYDEKKEKIIAAFLDVKEADKFMKQQKEKNPKLILEGYSPTKLKKMGKDPLNGDSWFDEPKMARGGKLKINKEYNWFVFDLHISKILAGNEYREDAEDAMKEIREAYPTDAYAVYSAKYIQGTRGLDPYDSDNWTNPGDLAIQKKAFLGMTLINSVDNTLIASSQGAAAM